MTTETSELNERLRQLGTHLDEERSIRRSAMSAGQQVSRSTGRRSAAAGRRGRPTPWLLSAAAALVIVAGGLTLSRWPTDSSTSIDATRQDDVAASESDEPGSSPEPGGDSDESVDGLSLSRFLAVLAVGIDPVGGPLVFVGEDGDGPRKVAVDYLTERMPDLSVEVVELETAPADQLVESSDPEVSLTLVRWSYPRPDGETAGSVLVRADQLEVGVVASIADAVNLDSIERSLDRLRVVVTDSDDDWLVADVITVDGEVVAGAPFPDGMEAADPPAIGTAGASESDRLEIDLEVESIPVVVRLQHLGGTWLSVTEFGVDAVGFEASCGSNPPVVIDVGEWLGALQDGPAPGSRRPALVNQGVWHHQGERASIEIRWPADPALTSRLSGGTLAEGEVGQFGPPPLVGYEPSSTEESTTHVLGPVDSTTADRCAIAQVSIVGQAAVVDWWSTAISGEWSFGLPLSVADLDPAVGPFGPGDDEAPGDDELVVDSVVVTERPAVAATGSCDGLPDEPPRTGPGPGSPPAAGPAAALATFVADPVGDPPLPGGGYTEMTSNGEVIGFVHGPIGDPVVVIEIDRSEDGWTVVGWSAAPC